MKRVIHLSFHLVTWAGCLTNLAYKHAQKHLYNKNIDMSLYFKTENAINNFCNYNCNLLNKFLQVITGSHDSTIRLWDLVAGKSLVTLTNHKKSVRSLALHPTQ